MENSTENLKLGKSLPATPPPPRIQHQELGRHQRQIPRVDPWLLLNSFKIIYFDDDFVTNVAG